MASDVIDELRALCTAARVGVRTARVEGAAAGQAAQVGRQAFDRSKRLVLLGVQAEYLDKT